MEKKQLYPIKFTPIPSRRPWGGNALIKKLGKEFVEVDKDGNERVMTTDDLIGESWELADMGFEDSVIANGWLAGNTIGEVMETYMERIVGDTVFPKYGTQFPLLIKYLDINDKLSVQAHPDDEVAIERYDSLGKAEIWYVMDVQPGAKVWAGFNRDVTAQELFDRCQDGTVDEILNVIEPKPGDAIFVKPGTVHAADGGILIAEIQESSDMTFRLYDWGREKDPKTARPIHLAEAMDLIDYGKFDEANWIKAEVSPCRTLIDRKELTVKEMHLVETVKRNTSETGSFLVYMCVTGGAKIVAPGCEEVVLGKGETVLVPADMPEFEVVPTEKGTIVLEAAAGLYEEADDYINPDTEAFLEGEDYEGVETLDKEEE